MIVDLVGEMGTLTWVTYFHQEVDGSARISRVWASGHSVSTGVD